MCGVFKIYYKIFLNADEKQHVQFAAIVVSQF